MMGDTPTTGAGVARSASAMLPGVARLKKRLSKGEQVGYLPVERRWDRYEQQLETLLSFTREHLVIEGSTVLELGPGDTFCLPLLMLAAGVRRVICLDRFDQVRVTDDAFETYAYLRDKLRPSVDWNRYIDFSARTFNPDHLVFQRVSIDEPLLVPPQRANLVYSFDVLEHVRSVPMTVQNLGKLSLDGGFQFHSVDMAGHGSFESPRPELEFLTVPEPVWQFIQRSRPVPNRERVETFRAEFSRAGLTTVVEKTLSVDEDQIDGLRSQLAPRFRHLPPEVLGVVRLMILARVTRAT